MSIFSRLIRFESEEHGSVFFADLSHQCNAIPSPGTKIEAFSSYDELTSKSKKQTVTIRKLLAPVPREGLPIYCVGLDYRTHAEEASLSLPAYPPLWTKPAASLAHPGEDIPINAFCAKSLLDYEGELVFVTSRECRDILSEEARSCILGYTLGNDLSCRKFQLPENSGGQYFFAKAFDNFAPIGPVLISPEVYETVKSNGYTVKVNGKVRQKADLEKDMIFSPEQILSHMSQGTTIPAGTAVMTGTPMGVGVFREPRAFLNDGDVVEIEMPMVGILKNRIKFV